MKAKAVILSALCICILSACTSATGLFPADTPTATPGPDAPPSATLTIEDTSQQAGIGTFCWNTQTEAGESVDMCVDKIGIPTAQTAIHLNSPVTARLNLFMSESPQQVSASIFTVSDDQELDVDAGDNRWWSYVEGVNLDLLPKNDQEIHLELEPGLYVLYVFVVWEGKGDVSYGFLIEVG